MWSHMIIKAAVPQPCRSCGYIDPANDTLTIPVVRPWHILGRQAVKRYVASLGEETYEWLLALFVDDNYNLLAVDTVARGDVGSCPVPFSRILCFGHSLGASGYVLVHNHPSGDPRPSRDDIQATVRLARLSGDMEIHLLDHLIIAGDRMTSVGYF